MKKFIIAVFTALLFSTVVANAQVLTYRSTEFAMGARNSSGSITWDDWYKSNIKMTIDWDNDIIQIFSQEPQKYVIVAAEDPQKDKGGTSVNCYAIDNNGLKCHVRLRVQDDGTSQLYVFYNDYAWVYNIIKI